MQDKSAGARQLAQDCLSELIAAGTVQPSRVRAATRDFQPAVMRQLKPALEKVLDTPGEISSVWHCRRDTRLSVAQYPMCRRQIHTFHNIVFDRTDGRFFVCVIAPWLKDTQK